MNLDELMAPETRLVLRGPKGNEVFTWDFGGGLQDNGDGTADYVFPDDSPFSLIDDHPLTVLHATIPPHIRREHVATVELWRAGQQLYLCENPQRSGGPVYVVCIPFRNHDDAPTSPPRPG